MTDFNSFFTEEDAPQSEATPSFSHVLESAINAKLDDVRTTMPAKVIKYDHEKQLVDVQPLFKKKYAASDTAVSMPIIYNVPVAFPRAGGSFMSMPIEKDHYVMIHFADRSMEKWLSSGGEVDPEDQRRHHPSDAIAVPGLYPFSDPAPVANATDIIQKNKGENNHLELRFKKNGHIQIMNRTDELIKVLNDTLTVIREAVIYTSTGRQQLRHWRFNEVQERLKTFLEK